MHHTWTHCCSSAMSALRERSCVLSGARRRLASLIPVLLYLFLFHPPCATTLDGRAMNFHFMGLIVDFASYSSRRKDKVLVYIETPLCTFIIGSDVLKNILLRCRW